MAEDLINKDWNKSLSINNDGDVPFSRLVDLTPREREQACKNIGVASNDAVNRLEQEVIQQRGIIASAVGDVASAINDVNSAVGSAQSALSAAQDALTAVNTVTANMDALSAKVDTNSGNIVTLSSDISTLSANVGTISGKNTSQDTQISSLSSSVAGLTNSAVYHEAVINNLTTAWTAYSADLKNDFDTWSAAEDAVITAATAAIPGQVSAEVSGQLSGKQDKLTTANAGINISISTAGVIDVKNEGGITNNRSIALGYNCSALGRWAFSHGYQSIASAENSYGHAEGAYTSAMNNNSHTEGLSTFVNGQGGHAEGDHTISNGYAAHAEGNRTYTVGVCTHAEGAQTSAYARESHTEGDHTVGSGQASHAEGNATTAIGAYSHTEGASTMTNASNAHAEGFQTSAIGTRSHSEGTNTLANAEGAHAEGRLGRAYSIYSHVEGQNCRTSGGTDNHAEGYQTSAFGNYSHSEGSESIVVTGAAHAEGFRTSAYVTRSHTEGEETITSGQGAHAEGYQSVAVGIRSHAEGANTIAGAAASHSEGYKAVSNGQYSHAEGGSTSAINNFSHAEGQYTITDTNYQHVEGQYNAPATGALHVIGNGSATASRSNIVETYTSGVNVNGNLNVSGTDFAFNNQMIVDSLNTLAKSVYNNYQVVFTPNTPTNVNNYILPKNDFSAYSYESDPYLGNTVFSAETSFWTSVGNYDGRFRVEYTMPTYHIERFNIEMPDTATSSRFMATFRNNSKLTYIESWGKLIVPRSYWLFYNCGLTAIPSSWDGFSAWTNNNDNRLFAETKIKDIPTDYTNYHLMNSSYDFIFDKNFNNCTALTGDIVPFMDWVLAEESANNKTYSKSACFAGCTAVPNYSTLTADSKYSAFF